MLPTSPRAGPQPPAMDSRRASNHEGRNAFQSPTFDRDVQIRVNETVGSASISPSGRDVVLASAEGLHIIDLDSPYSPPRHLSHQQQWPPADVQWSPFSSRAHWIVSTSNQKALVWNLDLFNPHSPIQHTLHAHSRAITDINFSANHPDILATCAVDSYVHCWDLRRPARPVMSFADWNAGATQVKWNRQDEHILASSHDKFLKIWDDRKGAYPLKTIQAHSTKIYGVDWNRTRPTGILTCSLDKSIKLWDYAQEDDKPERVIRTEFPVWRARHTPFGWGVLALPQRGDFDLHLYDRRLAEGVPRVGYVKPIHSFEGHHDHVKEFLWRARGDVENGMDNRDFQLISWGMDRDLHLHRIDPQVLARVGHEKGKKVQKNMPLTRKGAVYRTFREHKPTRSQEAETISRPGLLGSLVSASGMSKMPLPIAPVGRESGFMTYARRLHKRTVNPIKWMEGVTMKSRHSNELNRGVFAFDNPESLSNEMTTVSQRFTKVKFEKADPHGRVATVALNGPWGPEDKPAFLRVNFEFPSNYPASAAAVCTLERTAAGISEETMKRLFEEVTSIVNHYRTRRLGCLEAVITYLLGERGLEESITLPELDGPYDLLSPEDESSSDDDDAVDGQGQDLEASAEGALGISSAQTNVPLAKACGAYWSSDGRLVCFFPPKPEPKPLFSLEELRLTERSNRNHRYLEGFGRLMEDSPSSKRRPASEDEEEEASLAGSWTSSSSSSSEDSSEDITRLPSRFHPPAAWRAATLRFQKTSSHSGSGYGKREVPIKPKSIVSLHDLTDLLPAKKELAKEYEVFGSGPFVCAHNAEVASRNGQHELAAVWDIASHILHDEVPLEIMDQKLRTEPILVCAKRQIVHVHRKDSGLDLAFDEPNSVSNPKLTGRVKWGKHPFGSAWLIPELFNHFEARADIQMLAMLSCVFCEPAAREGVSNASMGLKHENLPIPMKVPAFSLDYFPSRDVAWSLFRESTAGLGESATPLRSTGPWDYFNNRIGTYGSAGSSNGPWGRDLLLPSGQHTPYSTGNTPPAFPLHTNHRSRQNSIINSPSTSPEQHQHRISRRSNSNLTATFSSFSRPFSTLASSPTSNDRFRSEADLSTSAPTSGITWGSTTFYSGSSSNSPEKRRRGSSRRSSFKTFDSTYSSSEDDEPFLTDDTDDDTAYHPLNKQSNSPSIKVTLLNQHLFDEEAHASVPLLPPENNAKYAAYREIYADQLSFWGLHIQRAEILKFNGLTNYWPVNMSFQQGESSQQQQQQQANPAPVTPAPTFPPPTQHDVDLLSREVQVAHEVYRAAPTSFDEDERTEFLRILKDPGFYRPSQDPAINAHAEQLRRTGQERNRLLQHPEILARDQHPGEDPLVTTERLRTNCCFCWERIEGIFVTCPTGVHKAHFKCHESFARGKTPRQVRNTGAAGCGCAGEMLPHSSVDAIPPSIEHLLSQQ